MPKQKKKNNNPEENKVNNDGITINLKQSSVAEFTKRPLPTDREAEKFEEYIDTEVKREEGHDFSDEDPDFNEEEIEESLNEIYQDDKGGMVDVKKLTILKKHGFFFWFFILFTAFVSLASVGYFVYSYYYLQSGSDATAAVLRLEGETEVIAGEEFFYTITFENQSNIIFRNARLELKFPENFIFLDSFPEASKENTGLWELGAITGQSVNIVKIKGMRIGSEDEAGIALASLTYSPENFSSEFKKEDSLTTMISGIGLELDFDYIASALVGAENEIKVRFNARENNYINSFRLTFEPRENIEIISEEPESEDEEPAISMIRAGVWQVNKISDETEELPVKFKFLDKIDNEQEIKFIFEKAEAKDVYYKFYEETLKFEVMKSDLNLTLIVNGSRDDQGISFNDTLNYSIVYNNKGETEMKDVIIMAVLESDYLNWTTLNDPAGGREKGNTISWTKEEIPALAEIERHKEGTIDFSIQAMGAENIEAGDKYEVKSFAQFSVGELEDSQKGAAGEDNRSNTIINKVNSDLKFSEEARYFNEDNITVGNGPLPLRVGEKTSLKIYWVITNNLHDLENVKVEASLPDYIEWDNKNRTNVGTITYDSSTRRVIWNIGRLPISVFRADGEFNISVVPAEEDRNKIMVLTPGSKIIATDTETKAEIILSTDAKTSKLEDDDIAAKSNDGIVR
ncbi:hypothetical protein DRH27_02490 [Candidatus Falkowbacteria bacterium]|nr:MAG: hypothetical protein DRH27_02490 [Candidatus Falkowbacteria bacterium]